MMPSPLSLETYFFTKIHLDACEKAGKEPATGVLSSKVNCLQHKQDAQKWMVTLGVSQHEDKEKGRPPYVFEVEAVGFFTVDKQYPAEKAEVLVRANGAAVLFGAIREMVANLSARGPFAQVNLPTVTFVDEVVKHEPQELKARRKAGAPRQTVADGRP